MLAYRIVRSASVLVSHSKLHANKEDLNFTFRAQLRAGKKIFSPLSMRGVTTPVAVVVLVAWLLLLGVIGLHRQDIVDYWRLHHYRPPAAMAQLADQDTMTAYARKVFYVNKPALDSKAAFASVCPSGTEQTVVLGCYHGGQGGIFLLSVSDVRLQGVEQVTAAHETLHAAYDRLSPRERTQLNTWLQDYYDHGLTDQTIKAQIGGYTKTEPHELQNEMHSILGSEVANLPPQLENYYKRYFGNRAQVVHYYEQYEEEFTSRQQAIKQYDAQLASLKAQIAALEAGLKGQQGAISTQQTQLTRLRDSNVEQYNAGVPAYNALVDSYNRGVNQLHALIAAYNALVDTRNALALEEQQLVQAISSNTTTIK